MGALYLPCLAMSITPAHPSEADTLTQIAFAAKRHWGYPEPWIALWNPLLTVTPAFIAEHETHVARVDGRIVGFMALVRDSDNLLRLEHLWVRPEAMGRGIGRALFRHAQRHVQALGFVSFEIESDPHAAGFYERMGAQLVRTNTSTLEGRPRVLPVFRCPASRDTKPLVSSLEADSPDRSMP
jgi:ribosomal protein S18 acetylase RimI-like enzyme